MHFQSLQSCLIHKCSACFIYSPVFSILLLIFSFACAQSLRVSDSVQLRGPKPAGSSVHGDSPGKNTGMGCCALLQGSSQPGDRTHISNLLHWQAGSLPTEPPEPSMLHISKLSTMNQDEIKISNIQHLKKVTSHAHISRVILKDVLYQMRI